MLPLLQKLKSFLKSHAWDESETVVAISGGPDSVALFRGLHELYPNVRLVLAQSEPWYRRGPESDADEAFVAALSQDREKRAALHRMDVAAQAASDAGNLEAVAQRLRYESAAAKSLPKPVAAGW